MEEGDKVSAASVIPEAEPNGDSNGNDEGQEKLPLN
jgi:hypothetical protein